MPKCTGLCTLHVNYMYICGVEQSSILYMCVSPYMHIHEYCSDAHILGANLYMYHTVLHVTSN